MLLDTELVERAAEALGTTRPTDTVRASLEQSVRRAHVANLVGWELPDDAAADLERQREARRRAEG
jgi:Arc/MetJ family transcription regulator